MTADGRHSTQTANHIIEAFSFANASDRAAGTGFTITAADLGKIAYQTDTGSYTRLTAIGPPLVWQLIVAGAASPIDGYYMVTQSVSGLVHQFDFSTISQGVLALTVSGGAATPRRAVPGVDFLATNNILAALSAVMSPTATAPAQRSALGLVIGTDVAAQGDARFTTITANNQTGTTYSLAITDAGKVVELNNGSAIALTVTKSATVAWVTGTVIELWAQGAGQVTLTPDTGVQIRSNGAKLKSNGQYSVMRLRYRGGDEWSAAGDLSA